MAFAVAWPVFGWAQDEAETSLIRFANQDQLPGRLESISQDQVVWDSSIQMKPTAFLLKDVVDLSLTAEVPLVKANHEATLTLARGDSVKGEIAAVTDEWIELDTWFAGRMKFPRVMVREVKIADRPEVLFRGPVSMDGWTQTVEPPAWEFQSSAFRSKGAGGIGRDVELPDEFRLSFEVAWRSSLNLSVILFSDDVSSENPENGYQVSFNRRAVRFQRCGSHDWLGSTNAQDLQTDEKAKIELRSSVRTKTTCLFVNGKLIDLWNDPAMTREKLGRGIQFLTQDNGQVRLSAIEVAAWDGAVDEAPEGNAFANRFRNLGRFGEEGAPAPVRKEKLPEGRMLLRNGDSIEGEVISISEGTITLKTAFRDLKLPVGRFRSLALKSASLEEPKRMNGDVRAWFDDGTSLVFRVDSLGGGKITGYSQNFGEVEFDLKAFTRIEFNIYDARMESLRSQNGW